MIRVAQACTTLAVLVLLAAATPAQANYLATATDPAGDATDPSPGRDITRVALSYDRGTGRLAGLVRFRGSPEGAPSLLTLFAGVRTATGCNGYPAAGIGSDTDGSGATWLRLDTPGAPPSARGDADKRGFDSSVQTFEVGAKALAGRRFNCAVATITEPGNAARAYDTSGPVSLVGQPELSVRVRAPRLFSRNRTRSVLFSVSNPGDATARGVKLRLGKARGMRVAPAARSLGTIGAGKSKRFRVKVRFSNRARTSTEVGVRASSGKLVARGDLRLRVRPVRRRTSPGGGGGRPGGACLRFSPDLSGQSGGSLILVPC